ncbi:MAG: nucleotidyltransferase domain-containing protein [Candidatus Dadabacteria bacterium]|nr:nucleotidyltransferase domain-containing protein [Candidatus Dadabacteria bacterium]
MEPVKSIDISSDHHRILLDLLEKHLPNTRVWVYGSRARFTAQKNSDLDMVVFALSGQRRQVGDLREAFEESDLPFRVDLFVWDDVPERFRRKIESDHVTLVYSDHETQTA